jgi:hypothetical protein
MKFAKSLAVFLLLVVSLPALSSKTVKVNVDRVNMDIPVRIGETIHEFRNRLEIAPGHRATIAFIKSANFTCDWDPVLQACQPCDAVDPRTGQNLTSLRRTFASRGNRTDEFADGSTISTELDGASAKFCNSLTASPELPEIGTYYYENRIIGGTGRFAGATGTLIVKGEYKTLWGNEAARSQKIDGELLFILE